MDKRLRLALAETLAVVLKSSMPPSMVMPVARTSSDYDLVEAAGVERLWVVPRMETWQDEYPDIRSSVWLSESGSLVNITCNELVVQSSMSVVADAGITQIPVKTEKKYFWTLSYLGRVGPDSVDTVCGFLRLLREQASSY